MIGQRYGQWHAWSSCQCGHQDRRDVAGGCWLKNARLGMARYKLFKLHFRQAHRIPLAKWRWLPAHNLDCRGSTGADCSCWIWNFLAVSRKMKGSGIGLKGRPATILNVWIGSQHHSLPILMTVFNIQRKDGHTIPAKGFDRLPSASPTTTGYKATQVLPWTLPNKNSWYFPYSRCPMF